MAAALAMPGLAGATTFEVQPHVFCPSSTSPCGYASETEVAEILTANFAEASLQFSQLQISFRMLPPTFAYGTVYNNMTGPYGDSAIAGTTNRSLSATLVDTIAAADKTRIHFFLIPGFSLCWYGNIDNADNGDLTLFCSPVPGWGNVYAHEFGHYFCLLHTQTWEDPLNTAPAAPDHDGDDAFPSDGAVTDTPEDPAIAEFYDPAKAAPKKADDGNFDDNGLLISDFDKNGNGVAQHTYCQPVVHPADAADPKRPDPGQFYDTYCEGACLTSDSSGTFAEDPSFSPMWENLMSYYQCPAPVVVGGVRSEPFTPDQIDLMRECLHDRVPHRELLVDACAARGGDTDNDGRCNDEDPCPLVWHDGTSDADGDGIPSTCDNCPSYGNADQSNIDGDFFGDICDTDIDGDGCVNKSAGNPFVVVTDDDIYSSVQHAGTWVSATCSPRTDSEYAFTGADTDGDTVKDCEDDDDDADGVPDVSDACPVVAGAVCSYSRDCGGATPFWKICQGAPCNGFFARVTEVSNPDPTALLFDRIVIWNEALYLLTPSGKTSLEAMVAVSGSALRRRGRSPSRWMLEIVNRASGAVESTLRWDSDAIESGGASAGNWLRVVAPPPSTSAPTQIDLVWASGSGDDAVLADEDADGIPDNFDVCPSASDPSQVDSDRDGAGNACDGDLDNDGLVGKSDLKMIVRCRGFDGSRQAGPPERCGVLDSGSASPTTDGRRLRRVQHRSLRAQRTAVSKRACASADLDGNARVDRADLLVAREMLARNLGRAVP